MNVTRNTRHGTRLLAAVAFTGMLALTGCASTPPAPTASLQAAQQAISSAELAEAGRYAPAELGEARTRLASANTAVAAQKMVAADQFAQESRADAELATAKTADVKANAVNAEMKHSTGTLIEEMQRNSGDKP
jgi:Domain of unknown function (DUF4398)